jgi:lipoprotein NlpI
MYVLILGLFLALAARDFGGSVVAADTVPELLDKARAALTQKQPERALSLADQAVALEPKNARTHFLRGTANESLRRHADAIADFTKAIDLDPKLADAYQHRGSEHFKLGHIEPSIADFDKYLELKPELTPGHWQRGISYYYAGRFEDGWKQFKGYEKVDTNDVENAVWHFLCLARVVGVDKARTSMLKIGTDKRVPLMQVYALFKGEAKPADVLAAATARDPKPAELNERLFYAHLYLGLYFESIGDKERTLEHMTKAAEDYKFPHYMGDVARVHLAILRQKNGAK